MTGTHPRLLGLPVRRSAGRRLSLPTFALALVLVAVPLVGCGGEAEDDSLGDLPRGPDVPIQIAAGEPVVIGVSTALTGPVGPRGIEYRDAVVFGIEEWKQRNGDRIAGHEIAVRAEDDGCGLVDVAEEAARRLARTEGLVGVIGPQCSGGVAAALPIFASAGIVAISGSATRTDLTTTQPPDGFFFRTAYRNDLEGVLIGSFIVDTVKPESWYLVDDGSAFGTDLANAAQTYAERAGVKTIRVGINVGDVDFGDLARRIAADRPGFVGFTGFNPEAALLLRQLRDAGYSGPFGAGDGAASQAQFVDPVGKDAEAVVFSGCGFPFTPERHAAFTQLHGHPPSATFSSQYVDAVQVLLDAVAKVAVEQPDGSLRIDPGSLRDAVRATEWAEAGTGPIAFDERGDRVPDPQSRIDELLSRARVIQDPRIFLALGLISCQVQHGAIVPVSGPNAAAPIGFLAGN